MRKIVIIDLTEDDLETSNRRVKIALEEVASSRIIRRQIIVTIEAEDSSL